MKLFRVPLLLLVLLLVAANVPQVAMAHDGQDDETTNQEAENEADDTTKDLLEQRREAAKKRLEEAKSKLEDEKEGVKERFKNACEARKTNFANRLENMAERTQKHIEVLDKITERVKAFKESKALTVANYDALLTEVEAKKLVAHNLQEAIKEKASTDFNCELGTAKETVSAFGDILHQQINALKDYKTAVKNLIVAVKTAAEATETTGGSNESE